MIKFEYLRDCKGAGRFGICMGCGRFSQDDSDMVRMKILYNISDHFQGVSICLCSRCKDELDRESCKMKICNYIKRER